MSQLLPHPTKISQQLVTAYRRALGLEAVANLSYPSLDGYLYGRVLAETLRSCEKRSKPSCIADTLEA